MKYDDILQVIGGFEKYQKQIILLMFLSFIPNGFYTMISVFILDIPEHHCKISTNKSSTKYFFNTNDSFPTIKDENGNVVQSQCTRYESNKSALYETNRSIIDCSAGWEYSVELGETTAVTEWDLVCDKAWVKPVLTSCLMAGSLVGGIIGGGLSDRFGRRPVFLFGFVLQFAANFLAGFSTSPTLLAVCLFVSGFSGPINYVGAFVLTTEVVISSKRAWIGVICSCGYAGGYMLLPLFAYFVRDWRWLMWTVGGTGVFYIPYYWLIPESPRWLIMNGKPEAENLLRKIAKTNGKSIGNLKLSTINKTCLKEDEDSKEIRKQFSYVDLFRYAVTRTRTLILLFIWISTTLTYYGLSLGTSNLGGNKFINCFVAAAVEVPANLIACVLIVKFGRRYILVSCYSISGIVCILSPYFGKEDENLMIISSMVGKFCITGAFTVIYVYTCELYPTKMRSMGIGAAYTFARFGSIGAPYLLYAGEIIGVHYVFFTMGGCALLSALLTLRLPETIHSKLPETLEDAIKQDRFRLRICKSRNDDDVMEMDENTAEQI